MKTRFFVKPGPDRGERYTFTYVMDSVTNKPAFEWRGLNGGVVCIAVCEKLNTLDILKIDVDNHS